jgi:hypothetical protein
MDQIYAYPLLRLMEDDPPLEVGICSDLASDRILTTYSKSTRSSYLCANSGTPETRSINI